MSRSSGNPATAVPVRPDSWAGLDPAERAATRRSLLLAAAMEILVADGESELTLRAVARRARLHTRYFYESFRDVEELLGGLFDSVWEDLHAWVLTAPSFGDSDDTRRHKRVRALFEFFHAAPERGVVIVTGAPSSPTLRSRRDSRRKEFFAPFAGTDGADQASVARLDDELRELAAFGAVNEILRGWLEGSIEASTTEVADRVTRILDRLGSQIKPVAR